MSKAAKFVEPDNHTTVAYIESMLLELRTMSVKENHMFLAYLIEMAAIEASDIASGNGGTQLAISEFRSSAGN